MSWNIKWDEVSVQDPLIPAGKYTLELSPGAKFAENGALKVSGVIVNDGEFTGKRVFFSYPNPEGVSQAGKSFGWSKTAFKRLIAAVGEDPQAGEPEDQYLNRVAGSRIRAQITHTAPTEQYPNPSVNVNLFNVEAGV